MGRKVIDDHQVTGFKRGYQAVFQCGLKNRMLIDTLTHSQHLGGEMAGQTSRRSLIRSLLFVVILSVPFLVPVRAEAKGILFITYGESITDISDLPAEARKIINDPELHFGYRYSYIGLFWLDIWTWGGEFCLFKGNTYQSISQEDAAKLMPANLIKKPFFYSYPFLLLLIMLSIAAVVLLGIFGYVASFVRVR